MTDRPEKQNGHGGDHNVRMLHERQQIFESIQRRLDDRRTLGEKFADGIVLWFGTFSFCVLHAVFFGVWVSANLGKIQAIPIFDPYPFNLLTMTVSLEAIFLSVFVLINQNRASKIADLRQEIDLQVNMIAEQEITKVIHLVSYLMKHMEVPMEKDPELKRMMKPLNHEQIRAN